MGVLVKPPPMRLDRAADRLGMGREQEAGHMDALAPQLELVANRFPVPV